MSEDKKKLGRPKKKLGRIPRKKWSGRVPRTIPAELKRELEKAIAQVGNMNQLAIVLDVAHPSVHNWLTGKTKPSLQTLLRAERMGLLDAQAARPELFI